MVVYILDALKMNLEIAIQILLYSGFLNARYGLQTMKEVCEER
jgi:hypothetical protein